jgi:hypothetical protein
MKAAVSSVLEGFVRHDMTPVTGGVSDAEEDRLVSIAGFLQRLFTPGDTSPRGYVCVGEDKEKARLSIYWAWITFGLDE